VQALTDKVVDDPRAYATARGDCWRSTSIFYCGDGVPILQSAKERLRELVDTFCIQTGSNRFQRFKSSSFEPFKGSLQPANTSAYGGRFVGFFA